MSYIHEIAGVLAVVLVFIAGGFTIYLEGLKYYKKVQKDITIEDRGEQLARLKRLK